ncbi:MAG: c-type cytochrome [Novipirellula sp. JB048]
MNGTLKRLLAGITGFAVLGVVVLVGGFVPIKASSGHWAITAWLLDFASDRSIAFHSNGIEVPPLDEPGMVALGAGIFHNNCQFCHGKPTQVQPPVAQGMTPTPPLLRETLSSMNDQELFYILKHGIKFAGMPAWPARNRDDEIWPVVAFLNQLPTMAAEAYRERIRIDDATLTDSITHEVAEHCASCHGIDGNVSVNRRVPVLSAQNRAYLAASLRGYRNMTRHSGVMMQVAYDLSEAQIDDLANYFAEQTRAESSGDDPQPLDLIQLGERLANHGDAAKKIPSCVDCHGPAPWLRDEHYPRLAGQPAWYIVRQLELFSEQDRGGDEAEIMHTVADKLDDESRRALAAYYANTPLFHSAEPDATTEPAEQPASDSATDPRREPERGTIDED